MLVKYNRVAQSPQGSPDFPMVSVCCITFNHEPYIRKAIDGFLSQETSFPCEVLIHDDASTDGTTEIVQRYSDRYPDRIFPVIQTENKYSKGVRIGARYNYPRVSGQYIALCEGDDYWTDPSKLQWQVDYLERNPSVAMCTHEVLLNIDEGKDVRSLRRKAAVLWRYAQLFGPVAPVRVLLDAFRTGRSIEEHDLTHRTKSRKKNGSIYYLADFSDGATHMSTCSIVFRRRLLEEHWEAFTMPDRGGHQMLLLLGAISGGVAHFHKIAAVKNNQPTSVSKDKKRSAASRKLASNLDTNEKIRRYRYLLSKCSDADRAVVQAMFDREVARVQRRRGLQSP